MTETLSGGGMQPESKVFYGKRKARRVLVESNTQKSITKKREKPLVENWNEHR